MTTITFEENINLSQTKFINIQEFLEKIAYEENLEEKIQIAQSSKEDNFINI